LSIRRKSIALCDTNSLIFWLNFALAVTEFCRMETNGERLAAIWELQTRSAVTTYPLQRDRIPRDSSIAVLIVARNFRVCGACGAQSLVSLVVENTTTAISMHDFD